MSHDRHGREEEGGGRYVRSLGLFDGTMVVVGGIVGAGIFLNPAVVAQRAPGSALILASWVLGGAVAVVGALCFAELGSRRPAAGGGYVYLRETFGPLPAFLYGWTLLLVINTGAIAAVAVTFARYAADLLALPAGAVDPLALGAIALLTGVNYVGVRFGSLTQNVFTVLKLAALAGLIAAGLLLAPGESAETAAAAAGGQTGAPGAASGASGASGVGAPAGGPGGVAGYAAVIGAALVPVLFSYGGWQNANFIAEEMVDPRRDLPRALLVGVGIVVTVYLLANWAYLEGLGAGGLAASQAPASDTMEALLGRKGAVFIGAGVAVSTFGILNLIILAAPRVYREMADDGLFIGWASRLHPRFRTPDRALLFQAGWAGLLLFSGTYAELLDYVVFGDWIFFALVGATLFVYRREGIGGGTVFRMPGYPWLPGLFVAASLYVVASSVLSNPGNALVGTAIIGAGVPVFYWWRRRT